MMRALLRSTVAALVFVALLAAPVFAATGELREILVSDTEPDAAEASKSPANQRVSPAGLVRLAEVPLGQGFVGEVEPNGTSATATPLGGNDVVAIGNNFPASDLDFWSFSAAAGDRVYAAVMTSFSPASVNSVLDVLDVDGTTILETDLDDGSFGSTSSSIAGAVIPANGTYYLRVRENATSTIRPYNLHFRLQSGAPTAEVEPNDDTATAQPLPANGWISGNTSGTTDQDWYSIALNAGDTLSVSLDLDPERDTVEWNGQLGVAIFGGFILVINDAGTATPDSEAHFMTAHTAGTYYVRVNLPTGGTTFGTYHLSVAVKPAADEGVNCTTYTSTDVPQTIPTDPGAPVVSSITVPGNPRIADIDVAIQLDHTRMADLDVSLISPAGNQNGLFTDVGSTAVGGQTIMNVVLDDEAGIPLGLYTVVEGMANQPEFSYRLSWFDGEDAGGTWTLDIRDDLAAEGGTLTAWSLRICEPVLPACGLGFQPVTVYSSDFEADDGGFTHSGTADEWERGLPTFIPITTCNSGVNCWKTDLDNTYNASSTQDLLSPSIDLTTPGLVGPVVVTWNQRYQIESATFDHLSVDIQESGGANPTRLFEWYDATMTTGVGNPSTTIQESSGWSRMVRQADAYLGDNIELKFHVDTDTSVQLAGVAIDDVTVTACEPAPVIPEITLTKTVGTVPAVCAATDAITVITGTTVHYCYSVENTGTVAFAFHDLEDDQLGVLLDDEPIVLNPGDTAEVIVPEVILAPVTNTATWTAATALPGYTVDDTIPYDFVDISATGTPFVLGDDEVSAALPIGFTFSYFGTDYTSTFASSNGFLTMLAGQSNGCCTGQPIPTPGDPDAVIAAWWEDLDPGEPGAGLFHQTMGAAPNRVFIVQFTTVQHFPSGNPVTFQYKLFETSNAIEVHYQVAPSDGGPHSAGVEDATGAAGTQYFLGTTSLPTPLALRYSLAAPPVTASDTDTATVNISDPDIAVDPASLSSFQAVDTQVVLPLDITNNGTADLDWDITESLPFAAPRRVLRVPGRQEPMRPNFRVAPPPANDLTSGRESFSRAAGEGAGKVVTPERGEAPDGTVTITHSASQSIISLNSVSCNAGGLHTDNSYIRKFDLGAFGITSAFDITQVEVGVEQAVGNGGTQPVTMNLYTWDPLDPFTFANFTLIGTANASVPDQSLTIITVPVTGTAPAGSTLVVELFTPNGQATGNSFFVGSNNLGQTDASYIAAADCGAAEPTDLAVLGFPGMHIVMNVTGEAGCGDDLTWVSANPTAGTTLPAATDTVDVTFDSTGLTIGGVYTGALCVNSNDPDSPTVQVPLTLEVDAMPFLDGFETGDTSRWTYTLP